MLRRLVAAITLIALFGPLVPARTSMAHDRHCLPTAAVAAVPAAHCSAGMGALCSTAGCLATPLGLAARPTTNISAPTDYAALLPLAQHLKDRLSAGPPTPPPNS